MRKLTIKDMDKLAAKKGGKCISRIYVNNYTKLEWECSLGHKWWAKPTVIKQGHWCHECAINSVKLTIEEMEELAASRGGKCLARLYGIERINSKTKLPWECVAGHIWWALPCHIKSNKSWCPYCNKHISEEKCRYIFEQLTGYKFPSDWKTLNNRQEIDGFNKVLKIGFEYQGEQHYRKTRRFSEKKFQYTQKLDIKKRRRVSYLKKQDKIKNIIFIKYTQSTSDEKLEKYIIKRLNQIDLSLIKNTKVDYTDFYKYLSPLNELKKIIERKGGKLLSKTYINNRTKIKIQCKNNHIFYMSLRSLKRYWCPYCAGNAKGTIEELRELIESKGGKLLSKEYVNSSSKVKVRCRNEHIFYATPHSLRSGRWCVFCSGKARGTIKELRKLVEIKGGKLLSKTYINVRTKVKIDCGNGHIFYMASNSIKSGCWCPYCYGNAKLTIKDMYGFAKQNNSICLSSIYANSKTKMIWKCFNCKNKLVRSYNDMINRKYFCKKCKNVLIKLKKK